MAFYTDSDIRAAARAAASSYSARSTLSIEARSSATRTSYDIFLSHSSLDAEQILGVKRTLEAGRRTVYVDWIDDPQLDRSRVDTATASALRSRMSASASFIFATSHNSPDSKWMPWELGYFDGLRGEKVAVLPLVDRAGDVFRGQEYLGLYPTIERLGANSDPMVLDWAGRRLAALASLTARTPTRFTSF